MGTLLFMIRLAAVLCCGVMAGVFFAFSTAVMSGLARLGPIQGMSAMQSINRTILNPLFLAVFMGSAVLCAIVFFTSLGRWGNLSLMLFLMGSLLYLVGVFLVTATINVPLNNALDAALPNSSESRALWTHYLTTWTKWNHLRTVASLLATVLLTLGLYFQEH